MLIALSALIRRHPLVSLFVLAYGITWLALIPFALGAFPAPMFPFGPFVAALVVAAVWWWRDVRSLLVRMIQWRAAPRWYAFALLIPSRSPSAPHIERRRLRRGQSYDRDPWLRGLVPAFAIMMLNPLQGSLGESLAWRALPRLLANRSPLMASLVLGVLVAGWHAPLFVTGLYGDAGLRILFIVTTTVLWTLLHRGTGGSVLLAMVFHTSWNLSPEIVLSSFAGAELQHALTLYMAGGIAVALLATIVAWRSLTASYPTAAVAPAATPAAA
jgi:hypothetical protein